MNTITCTTASVWIGCLSCYNAGDLVGDWFAASIADEVTAEEVHGSRNIAIQWEDSPHEEMWVMDVEGLPIPGECSPSEAAEWGRLLDEVDEHQRDALIAWVRSGDYVAEGTGSLPSLSDFEDQYAGEWDSFAEYAESLADDVGLLTDVPEAVARYFNWQAWTHDLTFDHTTENIPGGGVYVFRTL